jgi:UDP-N-acetylmuramoyl-tripeptide--D-alanyl-D-alanine ligase
MPTLKSEKSYNNEIGLPLTLLELRHEHRAVVLEMGTYGLGEITFLAQIARPQVGVVTNVSHSHLERMGTLETIARAKSELPAALPPDGLAVLNGDEPLIRDMAGVTAAPVVYFGRGKECQLRAVDLQSHGLEGLTFTVQAEGQTRRLRCGLPGRHSVYTALAAAAVARHLGLTWDEIAAGLLDTRAQLRLLGVPGMGDTTLLDDSYNASPVSSRAALELLAELPGRRVAVLGDMLELGAFEEEGHRLVGQWAAAVVEELFVLGPLARKIGEAALAQGMAPERVHFAADHQAMVALLREKLAAGDIVLIKGSRAVEMDRIVDALRKKEG